MALALLLTSMGIPGAAFDMQGLRVRLLLLFLAITVAVLGVNFHSTLEMQRRAEEQVRQNAMQLARLLSVNQEHLFEQAYQLLVSISRLPQVNQKDPAACKKTISKLLEPMYANLGVIGANGELICSGISSGGSSNLANQTYFKRALQSGDFAIGDFDAASETGKPVLNLAYPIVDSLGNPYAVAFASMDLAWLYQVAIAQLPLNATFNLLDDQGTVLVGNPVSEKAIRARKSIVREILGKLSGGLLELPEAHAAPRLIAFTPLGGLVQSHKLFVGLEMARQPSLYGFNRSWAEILTGPIILVLLITTGAWLGGDFFVVRGFHSLLDATKSLASGNLAVRSRLPHGHGELGQLARAFDHLADSLQDREQEAKKAIADLQSGRERQFALQEINLAITSTLDLTAILSELLDKLDLFLPYSAATVQLYNRETNRLEPIASRNVDEKEWKYIQQEIQWKSGLGLPNIVYESAVPLVVANAQTDPRTMDPVFLRQHGFVSYLGVPLIAKGQALGVVSFYTKKEHRFSGQEIDFLSVLAGQAAIAIHNSQLFIQVTNQALELEKSNKIKNEFLAVMSHELRTPLNIIMNYTDMVKGGMFGELRPPQDQALGKVTHQSHELLKMINGILEVTKLEAGTVNLEKGQVNVSDLMFSLRSEYGAALEKDVRLIWSVPPDIPLLESDGVRLKQILNYLIDNAIKFTEEGTVSVSVCELPEEGMIEFRVTDTGIGISEESIPLIFEKFRQIDSTDTRAYGGIGLGLYLARTYTRMLGGTMAVQSQLGHGATFTLCLPTSRRNQSHD